MKLVYLSSALLLLLSCEQAQVNAPGAIMIKPADSIFEANGDKPPATEELQLLLDSLAKANGGRPIGNISISQGEEASYTFVKKDTASAGKTQK